MTTKIKQVPMLPYSYHDKDKGWIYTKHLRLAEYEGEWNYMWDKNGERPIPTYVDNVPFTDTLTFSGYYRGRSAAGMIFKNSAGVPHTVFLTDFGKFVPIMRSGVVVGTFIYCKRGKSYGVKLHE